MKERIVLVEWDDASFNSGYYDKKDPERFAQTFVKTVGHLVKSTPKEIILSMDRWYYAGEIDSERHISTIPKKMIRKIVELKGG